MAKLDARKLRKRRHARIRAKVIGTNARPRLSVFRSLNHIYAQLIDDEAGNTLVAVSTLASAFKEAKKNGLKKAEEATLIGSLLGQHAKGKGIKEVVFDRGGYMYHGRIAALADAARKAGLKF
ncbi:MAG: 50S ribosomal protein L18 [Chloroflexi bacterium]|nr:50S ribosomal protein L18 [Chloroflexota bacterium]